MKTEVEMLRAAIYRHVDLISKKVPLHCHILQKYCHPYSATDMFLAGNDVTELASMIKLKSGRLVRQVGDGCLQFWYETECT